MAAARWLAAPPEVGVGGPVIQLAGAAVCELGCGIGLLGLACAKLGARPVVLTDAVTDALAVARLNAAEAPGAGVEVAVLSWMEPLAGQGGVDRPCGELAGAFDVVVGSDVLYFAGDVSDGSGGGAVRANGHALAHAQWGLSLCALGRARRWSWLGR